MAGLKEIKKRLTSVQNTKKITYAMKLVSAAKLRKAQEAVTRSREYTNALTGCLASLIAECGDSFEHPLMETRPVKRVRIIVAGGSRGLCGGYNGNLNKRVELLIKEKSREYPGAELEAVLVGRKPAEHFRRVRRPYLVSYEELPENANLWPIEEICAAAEKDFIAKNIDEVILVSTRFKSAISMTVTAEKLLPLDKSVLEGKGSIAAETSKGVTHFEPSAEKLWGAILPRIMRSRVRQAFLDARASEHGSRMTAMDSATKNSGDIISNLQLTYNKLRQGRITSELLDIIGGAEALS